MNKKRNILIIVLLFVLIIMTIIYFKSKSFISISDNPRVALISADYKVNSKMQTTDISGDEISGELNEELVKILLNTKIRNRILPYHESHSVEDGDTHIDIKVAVENNSSIFVHICNDNYYSIVMIKDKYYSISNSNAVFEEIYGVIFNQ